MEPGEFLSRFLEEVLHDSVLVEPDDDDLFEVRYLRKGRDRMPNHGLTMHDESVYVLAVQAREDGWITFPAMGSSGFGAV
jgi:hypothetical protein